MHLPLVGLKQGWPSKLISTLLTYNLNVHGLPTPLNIGLHFGHVAAAHHLATEDLELGLSLLALAGPLLMHLTISMGHHHATLVTGPPVLVKLLVVLVLGNANDHLATGWTNVGACVMGPLNMIGKVFPQNFLGTMLTQHF